MNYPFPYTKFRAFVDTTNLPLVGGKLYAFEINTATPKDLYADSTTGTPLAHPVVLDSNGEATIYGVGTYDLRLDDADDVTQWTADDITFESTTGVVINTTVEWIGSTAATYISASSFTVVGDQTATFLTNRRVKCVRTATTVYGTVVSSAYTTTTLVTVLLDSGTLDTDLTTASVGLLSTINDSIPRTVPQLALNNTFTGTNTFTGAVVVDDALNVTGSLDVDTNLNVDGSAVIDLTLSVGTDLTVGDDLIVTDDASVGGDLIVTLTLDAGNTTVDALGVGVAAPAAGVIQNSGNIEAGGYVYAPDGFKQPGTGGEILRFVRGVVDSAGSVTEGSGFTAVRNSTGDFTITFSTAFSDVPSFCAHTVGTNRSVTIVSASISQVNYQIRANNDNALANNDHHIQVVGPK
jgi:hypothetical protein